MLAPCQMGILGHFRDLAKESRCFGGLRQRRMTFKLTRKSVNLKAFGLNENGSNQTPRLLYSHAPKGAIESPYTP